MKPRPALLALPILLSRCLMTHERGEPLYPATEPRLSENQVAQLGGYVRQVDGKEVKEGKAFELLPGCHVVGTPARWRRADSGGTGGVLVDTVGRKGLLMAVSLFWIGFPYLLIGFTHSYLMLLACVALVGFGNSLWHPTAIPTLGRRYPERKGLVLSVHGMGGNVGDAVAPVIIGAALTYFSWREAVVLNVVPGLVVAALLFVFLGSMRLGAKKSEHEPQSFAHYLAGLKDLLASRALVLLSTGSAFRTMTQTTLLTFLPVYLAHDMGYSPFRVGACLFALQAAEFTATPIAGHLSDRMGRKQILMSSMAATALVLAAMAFSGGSPLFIALVAVLGFFLYATRPVIQAWMLESTPKNMGGSSIGVLFGAQALGGALGPLLGGIVADRLGLLATFYFLAATIVVANLFVFGVTPSAAPKS